MTADDREKNLPKWAQELIGELRTRPQYAMEAAARELAVLRPQVERLKRQVGALEELLLCAARGGHATAQTIIEVLNGHSLTLTPDDE